MLMNKKTAIDKRIAGLQAYQEAEAEAESKNVKLYKMSEAKAQAGDRRDKLDEIVREVERRVHKLGKKIQNDVKYSVALSALKKGISDYDRLADEAILIQKVKWYGGSKKHGFEVQKNDDGSRTFHTPSLVNEADKLFKRSAGRDMNHAEKKFAVELYKITRTKGYAWDAEDIEGEVLRYKDDERMKGDSDKLAELASEAKKKSDADVSAVSRRVDSAAEAKRSAMTNKDEPHVRKAVEELRELINQQLAQSEATKGKKIKTKEGESVGDELARITRVINTYSLRVTPAIERLIGQTTTFVKGIRPEE